MPLDVYEDCVNEVVPTLRFSRDIPCYIICCWSVGWIASDAVFNTSPLVYADIVDIHLRWELQVLIICTLKRRTHSEIQNDILIKWINKLVITNHTNDKPKAPLELAFLKLVIVNLVRPWQL